MGMLLQPHTPGAKSLRTPSKTEPSQEREKNMSEESFGYEEDLQAIYAE